jgi:uncharacterized membrane protein YdjX (TVP38/TMEM64 family)
VQSTSPKVKSLLSILPSRVWIALFLLTSIGILALTTDLKPIILNTLAWIQSLGPAGIAVFSAVYITTVILLIPATFLALGAGALFGIKIGFPIVWISVTTGATGSFLLGRGLVRDWVEQQLHKRPMLAALDQAVTESGWKIVTLSRLCPFFPFPLLNYAFGASKIPLPQYVLSTAVGVLPGVLLYVWIGNALGNLAGLHESPPLPPKIQWLVYGGGAIIGIVVAIYTTHLARIALKKHLQGELAPQETPASITPSTN